MGEKGFVKQPYGKHMKKHLMRNSALNGTVQKDIESVKTKRSVLEKNWFVMASSTVVINLTNSVHVLFHLTFVNPEYWRVFAPFVI